MVLNLQILKDIAEKAFVGTLDHHNLDQDVPHFTTTPSTVENLVVFVWETIKTEMMLRNIDPKLLHEVAIQETDSNSVVYRGED
jgi:6-pyruvoyl-tetrahydropterin synthase